MVYNSINSVRMETGNLLPADFPDSEITLNIENAYSQVQLGTGRTLLTPFVPTDTEFGLARELEKRIAAKNCLKAYGPEFREKVQELDAEIQTDMTFLKENLQVTPEAETDVQILMGVTPYASYGAMLDEDPTNPNLRPYRGGLTSCCSVCGCSQASNLSCCCCG